MADKMDRMPLRYAYHVNNQKEINNACIKVSVLNSGKCAKNNAEILNGRLTVIDCYSHQKGKLYMRQIIAFALLCTERQSNVLCIQGFVQTCLHV
jgi:hypothetical protein